MASDVLTCHCVLGVALIECQGPFHAISLHCAALGMEMPIFMYERLCLFSSSNSVHGSIVYVSISLSIVFNELYKSNYVYLLHSKLFFVIRYQPRSSIDSNFSYKIYFTYDINYQNTTQNFFFVFFN